jgi:hypothetical protein
MYLLQKQKYFDEVEAEQKAYESNSNFWTNLGEIVEAIADTPYENSSTINSNSSVNSNKSGFEMIDELVKPLSEIVHEETLQINANIEIEQLFLF